jgi:uncharacterized secreted protein with C-terminal beta-propeller domain/Ca2+-binding RTX toxin-like protein
MTVEGRTAVRRATQTIVEQLEQRRMLSANLEDGQWGVEVDYSLSVGVHIVIDVDPNDAAYLRARINGKRVSTVAADDVTRIWVNGGEGDDRIEVDLGGTTISVMIYGGAGNDTLIGGAEHDYITGHEGDDQLMGGGGWDNLIGGTGDDTLDGGDGDDLLYGCEGNDQLYGGKGDDYLDSDQVLSRPDDAQVDSEIGNDTLDGGNGDDDLTAGEGDDLLAGGRGDDGLVGGPGDDILDGGLGDDRVFGGEGDDELAGGGGNDALDGGLGYDLADGKPEGITHVFEGRWIVEGDSNPRNLNDRIVIELLPDDPSQLRAIVNGKVAGQIAKADIHTVWVVAGKGNDRINVELGSDELNCWIAGGAGDDTLTGGNQVDYFNGEMGNDVLAGGAGNDELYGDEGNDQLDGGAGNDGVYGGDGDNVLSGGQGDDDMNAFNGNDYIDGNAGDDFIDGGDGDDTLRGGGGNDVLWGRDGDDRLNGLGGNDTLAGGTGDDSLAGRAGDDDLLGGVGNDTIQGGDGDDQIGGGRGNDELIGDGGDDEMVGQAGNDSLAGGTGDDSLTGGVGADQAQGGFGDDSIAGGKGRDTLWGGDGTDSLSGGAGVNTINYEEGTDQVEWSPFDTAQAEQFAKPLVKLEDADQLKQWIIEEGVRRYQGSFGQKWYGHFGYDRWYKWGEIQSFNQADAEGGAPEVSAPDGYSTTNTQERDVDEADLTKTDGRFLYILSGDELVILDIWPAAQTHIVSHTRIQGNVRGLYLDGDQVAVLSETYAYDRSELVSDQAISMPMRMWRGSPQTQVTILDVSDRAAPRTVEVSSLEGSLQESRMVNGRLYLVVNNAVPVPSIQGTSGQEQVEVLQWIKEPVSQLPDDKSLIVSLLYWQDPAEEGQLQWVRDPEGIVYQYRAQKVLEDRTYYTYESEEEYRARFAAMSLAQLLPRYTTTSVTNNTTSGSLAQVDHLYVPADHSDFSWNMMSTVLIDLRDQDAGPDSSTSVVGYNGTIYASANNLYVAGTDWWNGGWWDEPVTSLYKFSLGTDDVELTASGQVPGWIVNQFAMDEQRQVLHNQQDDFLRIATTSRSKGQQENNVFVLQEKGDDLQIIGGVTGLGKSERIYSVRFVGDKGYLVTFRQTDPLFTLDLSDPQSPKAVGELKIPGYSSYLHPIGDQYLIGVGRDADESGRVNGVQLSLFDVANLRKPKRIATYKFASDPSWWSGGTWSAAEWDHHAFSYFPEQQILALPMFSYRNTGDSGGLEVLKVDPATGFTLLGTVSHNGQPQRSVRVDKYLYSIGYDAVKVVELEHPGTAVTQVPMNPVWNYGSYDWGWPILRAQPIDQVIAF